MNNETDISHHVDVPLVRDETETEYISDAVLGIAFLIIGVIAAQR
jgi:hypothetical protein